MSNPANYQKLFDKSEIQKDRSESKAISFYNYEMVETGE